MKVALIALSAAKQLEGLTQAFLRADIEPILQRGEAPLATDAAGFVLLGDLIEEGALAHDWLQTIKEQCALGKPVLGLAQGARVLVESGLVPGIEDGKSCISLVENQRERAQLCVQLATHYQRNAFTQQLTHKNKIPVLLAERPAGFVIANALLHEMKIQGLNVFEYCDEAGNAMDAFSATKAEAASTIAALSNKAGNVLAVIPEFASIDDWDPIILSMHAFMANPHLQLLAAQTAALHYYPR